MKKILKSEQAASTEERLLEKKVRAAGRTLLFEKLWPRVWVPLAISGIFVLLSAFEVWQILPPALHLILLWVFGVAFVLSLLPLLTWKGPSREKSLKRLEQASGLEHRPLTAFNDTLSAHTASEETKALWQAHRNWASQALRKLRAGTPHPRIDKYDPFALRAALILMIVAVVFWARSDLGNRIAAGFSVAEIPGGSNFRVDAWISPPAYTRKEPFVLANGTVSWGKDAVAVPEGSILTVKINGSGAADYHVAFTGSESEKLNPVSQSGDSYAEYTKKIEQSGTLSVGGNFKTDASWKLNVVTDQAPSIGFVGPIDVSPRAVMLFKYKVDDDYGVVSAEAHVERVMPSPPKGAKAQEPIPTIGKPPVFPLALPRAPVKSAEAKTYKDLTAHPWAGLPVVITLTAKDEAGHEGRSAPRGIILPERKFTKPLAKAVIDQRRSLVENPNDTFRVAGNLNALATSAEDEGLAPAIYLSLRSAYWRLRGLPPLEEIESSVDQLWDIATRIEDGNLSACERDLRAGQEQLKDAIERGAPQDELQKLTAQLRQALNCYLQALMQQEKNISRNIPLSPNAKTVTPKDLQQLIDKIERLAKIGSPEAAAQMLNELRDILESLQAAKQGGQSEQQNAEDMQRLDRLTDIMRQQQNLLDQTFRAQQSEQNGQNGNQRGQRGQRGQKQQGNDGQSQAAAPLSPGELKKRQADLQQQLEDLLSEMGQGMKGDKIREKLREAERAMGDAGDALDQNELGEAGDQEGRALENLRQGMRGMAEDMMRSNGNRGNGQANRDPMGRRQGNQLNDPGDNVKVPDEITVQRAREILEELRRRLGQPARPPAELDYLERLVKPY